MRCNSCDALMTSLEIKLFKDVCEDCADDIESTPMEYLTIPNHGGPLKFDTTNRKVTEVIERHPEEGAAASEVFDSEVMDAFTDKATLSIRDTNVGASNYAKHKIQPWDIWLEYNLNPSDADIIKRMLRVKVIGGMTPTEARIEDYEKIKHICDERIAQLEGAYND